MPVNTRHPAYEAHVATWQILRDAYAGSDAIRAAGEKYVPRPSGMKGNPVADQEWKAYLHRPEWYNATARTVQGLSGAVYRKDPQIDVLRGDGNELLRQDITGTGVFLLSFLQMVMQENIHMGRYGILVDFDADQNRPVWSGYAAEMILNWDDHRTFVVLQEDVEEVSLATEDVFKADDGRILIFARRKIVQWRVLSLMPDDRGSRLYRQDIFRQIETTQASATTAPQFEHVATIIPLRRAQPLDFIPFTFVGPETTEPDIARSPIWDLVRLNLRYWRHSADYEHGLHLTCVPTPWATGHNPDHYLPLPGEEGKQAAPVVTLGSGQMIILPEPDAKIGILRMSADDLGASINALETDKRDMATLGARLLEERPDIQETATAVRLRHSGDESVLKGLANTVSFAVTQCLRWDQWWRGNTEDPNDERIRITLNTDFVSLRIGPQEIQAMRELQESGQISAETFFYNLSQGEIIEPGVTYEEERARIEATPPMTMRLGANGRNPFEEEDDETEE